jgi:hypothetical protein
MHNHISRLEIKFEDHILDSRQKDLPSGSPHDIDIVRTGFHHIRHPAEPFSSLCLHVHPYQLKVIVLTILERDSFLHWNLNQHPPQILSRIPIAAASELDQEDVLVRTNALQRVAVDIVRIPRTGQVEIVVLCNPLGIISEDFNAKFSPDPVRPTHAAHNDIGRLRVLFLS